MLRTRRAGCGGGHPLLPVAVRLLALLAALHLTAGLPAQPHDGRRALRAAAAPLSQLPVKGQLPPPPPLLGRRDLLTIVPPRRNQRRPSRQWWDSLEPLWADEFAGSVLDSSKWEMMEGDGSSYGIPGWGNNELQNYTRRWTNVRVMNGNLVIQAQAEPPGSPYGRYTSGRIRTAGRFFIAPSETYPLIRIQARIKLDAGEGMWPAFWMLPQNWLYGNWPQSGEIDIMEAKNGMDSVLSSLHFGSVGAQKTVNGVTPAQLAGSYHVFAVEWEADRMRFYLDGRQYFQAFSSNGTGTSPGWHSGGAGPTSPHAPFDVPFHLLLNQAVGGNFPWVEPAVVAQTLAARPRCMYVDWVHVYGRPYR